MTDPVILKHINTANYVRTQLENGPLTAQEVLDGVRLSHEEYLDLVRRAVENNRQSLQKRSC